MPKVPISLDQEEPPQYPHFNPNPSMVSLFLFFLRFGITAVGGPAMLAYLRTMVVERKKWLNEASFRDGLALCQTIPGATLMQMVAYIGLRIRGVAGAAASFIGCGLPAFSIMMLLSALYMRTHSLPSVVSAFSGLQTIVVAIVANATLSFGKTSLKEWRDVLIAIVAAGIFGLGASPILAVLLAPLLGLVLYKGQVSSRLAIDSAKKPHSARPLLFLLLLAALEFALLFLMEPRLFHLAALMSKIDLFAFGGGFASVPLMFHEVVNVRSWLDAQTFLNGIALGQVTPGPIVITATFVGYLLYGPIGGLVGTVNVFLPSFLILVGIVPYFDRLRSSPTFGRAIRGIVCSFVGLLLTVTIRFAWNIPWDISHLLLAGAAVAALLLKVDILWVVLVGTVISVMVLRSVG